MIPRYGAIGATFQLARLFQACSLIAIIGIDAKFISLILGESDTPPSILIGALVVACVAVIFCIISQILYMDDILPFLPSAAADFLILIGLIVVSVVMGKPLSYLNCSSLSNLNDTDATGYAFVSKLESYTESLTGKIDYSSWIGASKTICVETKAIWGLCIALCVLFCFSTVCTLVLWRQKNALLRIDSEEK
ncbi:uncharacterized protein N7483_004059 [Penicillium malachiteum]|uniref:uncharacterized protein n=1 Tax=Penicillium malachiteum TaxID=1324776 RepID=UPI002547D889|nr:uncharacterized protein N7483_004059 [Penicillium malachiteum]KAJ5729551.1 hypothetical protein N7483_004059 [Penicillium malachiteum]